MTSTDDLIARPNEHPFAPFVRILGKGKTGSRSLTAEESERAMAMIMAGQVEDVQLGAFLMLLRVKEESRDELTGFVRAVRAGIAAPDDLRVDLDWSSYAGKRRQLPWYLLSALALADSGVRVFMHGAAGHTAERIYSEGVLRYLGIAIAANWQEARAHLDHGNFAFLPLSAFCPPLQRIIDLRNLFGLRSPVHTLARLINPAAARYSIQSIFHPAYGESHQQAAQMLGQPNAAVFKGEAGEVERKPEAVTLVRYVRDGDLSQLEWPRLAQGRQDKLDTLDIDQLRRVWRGESEDEYGEMAAVGTLAIALHLLQKAATPDDAMGLAQQLWRRRNQQRL